MRNLCDLFLHELAHLDGCIQAVREGIDELCRAPATPGLRPLLYEIEAIACAHVIPLNETLAQHDVVTASRGSPALLGIFDEARKYLAQSDHPSVSRAGILGVLRRMTRYMECLCLASAESALLLGFDDIRRDLTRWSSAWRDLERQIQRASRHSNAAAYLAS